MNYFIDLSHSLTSKSHTPNRSIEGFISFERIEKNETRANYPHSKCLDTYMGLKTRRKLCYRFKLLYVFTFHSIFDILHALLQTEMVMDMAVSKRLSQNDLENVCWIRAGVFGQYGTSSYPFPPPYSIQYVSLCLHVCVVYFYPTHTRTIHETQRTACIDIELKVSASVSVCITVILLRMTHNESVLCTLSAKKKERGKAENSKLRWLYSNSYWIAVVCVRM